ncbi:hypothetical protein IB254_09435 [Pseudomonas sp. PDM03]|uniref:hypothetical protein n=1 Tax=Pseudomonas sp. PDM03 TaxID=2769266 RepID=UPI001782361A|nr:hypothetical protein [Pseudomonas sp. PDM03]MBD9587281.1 hypothetical protein [Pseudomonas sp. PDM03]
MTEVSDGPSILTGHGMKTPIEGGHYRSPFVVAGTSPYSSGGLKNGRTVLDFHQFAAMQQETHQYASGDGSFSYTQTLEPGPWWLGVRHKWWWSSGGSGDETDFLGVGNFYVLTPPRNIPPAAE